MKDRLTNDIVSLKCQTEEIILLCFSVVFILRLNFIMTKFDNIYYRYYIKKTYLLHGCVEVTFLVDPQLKKKIRLLVCQTGVKGLTETSLGELPPPTLELEFKTFYFILQQELYISINSVVFKYDIFRLVL